METSKLTDNELIAEFMKCSKPPNTDFDYFWRGEFFKSHNAKWNTSWDWLMPVVEKIQNLDGSFSIHLGYGHMSNLGMSSHYAYCHIENWKGEEVVGNSGRPTLIESVYTTAVDFIKWYNQQPK